jgi:hypothetical protein
MEQRNDATKEHTVGVICEGHEGPAPRVVGTGPLVSLGVISGRQDDVFLQHNGERTISLDLASCIAG